MPCWSVIAETQTQDLGKLRQALYQLHHSPIPGLILQGGRKLASWVCNLGVHWPRVREMLGFSQCSSAVILNPKQFFEPQSPVFTVQWSPQII